MTKQTQSKSEASKTSIKHDPHALRVEAKEGDEPRAWAETILKPNITAALTLKLFTKQLVDIDAPITELTEELARQSELVSTGNLQRCESMLVARAQTLDVIFNSLAVRSWRNMGENTQTADLYMRLALKAQSQCRTTIEAIAEMKNPKPIAFVKQANIAAGNQQVNNGNDATLRARACAREKMDFSRTNNYGIYNMRHWTAAQRERQAELIQQWQPWNQSTGPRTHQGKAKVSQNAFKGGMRVTLRKLAQLLRECA